MAVSTRDPVLDQLRRSSSLSSATSFSTRMSTDYDSSLSLEALGASDIGKPSLCYRTGTGRRAALPGTLYIAHGLCGKFLIATELCVFVVK